ncbi:M1 family aminopeptidase [Saccharothrix variisporea]|uniref:Aminopeptidase N n=1 Tax=Saccharothrix variisporea TaxID=543527 RepID=A0A495X9P9_9PSEU|nr:M1 family aminopeptidase [Saccharothrix variisporea]RKT70722.1 aminopeptidase N [Saccharothrix variisporea]
MTVDYTIAWHLEPTSFRTHTRVSFPTPRPHALLEATDVRHARLNGHDVPWDGARLALGPVGVPGSAGVLEVESVHAYAPDRGFRRVEVDGDTYRYTLHHPTFAPRTFCCLDHTTRATTAVTVHAPGNALVSDTRAPVAPHALAAAVGPWAEVGPDVHAARSRTFDGRAVSALVARSVGFFEDLLDVPYPYGSCRVVLVPELPVLGFSSPGLVLLDTRAPLDLSPLHAATVVAHEVAHQWAGNVTDGESSLVEGLATYLSRLAAEAFVPGADPWTPPTGTPWPDRPYAPHLARVVGLEARVGRKALVRALGEFFRAHRFGEAGWADLEARA